MKIAALKPLDRNSIGLSVMDLYIIRELILPFLFGMGIFTSLGLSIGAVFELIRQVTDSGLFWGVAAKVLLLRMPEFIVFAFPMSILLATLMAYSRLSSDSELIALRSIGVNMYRLIMPALAFSLCIVAITFWFNNFVAPAASYQASVTLKEALGTTRPNFETQNILFPEYDDIETEDGNTKEVLTRLFYAEEFDGEQMKNLTVLDRSRRSVSHEKPDGIRSFSEICQPNCRSAIGPVECFREYLGFLRRNYLFSGNKWQLQQYSSLPASTVSTPANCVRPYSEK